MKVTLWYSWLCLCLLFCSCCLSCTVTHKVSGANITVRNERKKGIWEVKVRLLPGFTGIEMPELGMLEMPASYDPNGMVYFNKNFPGSVVLIYRLYNWEQYKKLMEELTQSGMVEIINVSTRIIESE